MCSKGIPSSEKSSGLAKRCPRISSTPAPFPPAHSPDEFQLFPVRINHHVDVVIALRSAVKAECQAARVEDKSTVGPTPYQEHILPPEPAAAQRRMTFTETQSSLEEPENVRHWIPVDSNPAIRFHCPGYRDCYCRIACSGIRRRRETSVCHSKAKQAAKILYLLPAQRATTDAEHASTPSCPQFQL